MPKGRSHWEPFKSPSATKSHIYYSEFKANCGSQKVSEAAFKETSPIARGQTDLEIRLTSSV